MENNTTSPAPVTPKKPKKKECTAGQSTNLAFASISLFVLCAIFIAMGIYFLIGIKAYLGGVLLILFGISFAVINIVLNKSSLFKKTSDTKAETKTENEQ